MFSSYHRAMLTEEALLLVFTLVACLLVILGTLELIVPSHPRRSRRRPSMRRSVPPAPSASTSMAGHEGLAILASVPPEPECPSTVVARSAQLLRVQRYAEVVTEATAALAPSVSGGASLPGAEAAALWSLLGSARHAVGDDEGARQALESALALASAATRTAHEGQLVALAVRVAQARLDRAVGEAPCMPEDRLAGIQDAIVWLDRGIAVWQTESALVELRLAARTALGPAYEDAARSLANRHEYSRARCLLGEALADPELAATRGPALRELLAATFNSEIGHLSAQAFLSVRESRESEALDSLRRVEDLIDTMPDDALSTTRREEVDRRLLWGYTRLGRRHVESGEFEAAVEPLLHALRLDTGREAAAETRTALIHALEALVESRGPAIHDLAADGDRDGAVFQCEKLRALLASASDAGLTHDDLAAAFARARRLVESLDVLA
jgi:tetratricopeptide (TPR) repeat protein